MVIAGIKAKVENKGQYELYLQELKDLREELGVALQEELYPANEKKWNEKNRKIPFF